MTPAASPVGAVPKDWNLVHLGDLAEKIGSGATPKGGERVYLPVREKYALIRSQNVFDRYFSTDGLAFISNADVAGLQSAEVREGDILLNITGDGITFGRACLVPVRVLPAVVNQHVTIIRLRRDIAEPGYLLSYLTHPTAKHYMESFNAGGSRRAITKGHIESFVVPLPSLHEQRAVANLLGTLDDKIELNRRMNETLEDMARGIFKSWFVDFDPVRAKAEGRQPFGMDAATAALFPDSLVDSPLGKVPRGWRVIPLPEAIEVNPGRALPKGRIAPYLDMANMPTRGHRPDRCIERPAGSGMRFINGDTLLARITPCLENGKTAFVDFLQDGQVGWGSTEYIVLRPRVPLPPAFGYYLARSEGFRTVAIQNMTGSSGRQRVPAECLGQFLLAVPPGAAAQLFGSAIQPFLDQIRASGDESRTLAAIRDALLPKLVSGEVRVGDAERLVLQQG